VVISNHEFFLAKKMMNSLPLPLSVSFLWLFFFFFLVYLFIYLFIIFFLVVLGFELKPLHYAGALPLEQHHQSFMAF
jgi:hypothetical protein